MRDIPELNREGLRKFGWQTGGMIAVLFGLIFPLLFSVPFRLWPWIVGGTLAVWGLVAPQTLKPVYRVWMRIAEVIGGVMNRVVLTVVFFLVITPFGSIMRLFGRDPMDRKVRTGLRTYRKTSTVRDPKSLDKPF